MPWSVSDVDEHKEGLTQAQKRQWVEVANSVRRRCLNDGNSESYCDGLAIRQASGVVGNIQHITNQITNANIRRTTFHSRAHVVAPVVLMTEGVHHGSAGRILYTAEELSRMPMTWNGRPVPIMHPTDGDGSPRSCNDPDVLESQTVGRVFNVQWEPNNHRLKGELWVDETTARQVCSNLNLPDVIGMMHNGDPVEVSTGLFPEQSDEGGVWNGQNYDASAVGICSDHLALLPSGQGACSWQDGCGVRNQNGDEPMKRTKQPRNQNQEQTSQEELQEKQHTLQVNVSDGYMELMRKLSDKVDSLDNEFRVNFLEDFNDEQLVYRIDNREAGGESYYRRSYAVNDDGTVEFGDDIERVNKKVDVTWIPIQSQAQNTNKNNGGGSMGDKQEPQNQGSCPEKVEAVINGSGNSFTVDDREKLQALDEGTIDKIPTETPEPATNQNQQENQEVDFNTLLQNADPELRQSIERGRELYRQERQGLAQRILNNSSQFTQEELDQMDHAMLQKVANSIKPTANYKGAGGAPSTHEEEAEDGIGEPWKAPATEKQQ